MRRTKDGNGNMVEKLKMKIIKYTNADEDKNDEEGEREIKRQKRKRKTEARPRDKTELCAGIPFDPQKRERRTFGRKTNHAAFEGDHAEAKIQFRQMFMMPRTTETKPKERS